MKDPYHFIASKPKLIKRHKALFKSYMEEKYGGAEFLVKKARFECFDTFCHLYFDSIKPANIGEQLKLMKA